MENEKIARGVKAFRKLKGLSQEVLANKSGLSLRTVQRVENGETEPTGETLKRISAILDVTLNELIELGINNETPKKTVKTKHEYLHIFDNKLVISKTPKINDLVEDYGKSINNVFKTLMVFFIGIPIFTTLAIIFYNMDKTGLSINAGAFAFLFLVVAFYTILFTSGTSLIKKESISKIFIKKALHQYVLVILHAESGRFKERYLVLEKGQIDTIKDSLFSEKLIKKNNVKLKTYIFSLEGVYSVLFMSIFFFVMVFKKADQMMFYYGAIFLFTSLAMIIKMIIRTIIPIGSKTTNR